MRELRFRAWNKRLKMMCVVTGCHFESDIYYCESKKLTSHTFGLIDLDIMQYTGLKDKNGREVFEGDILDCGDRIVKVVWHDDAGCFDCDFIKYIFTLNSNGCTNQEWKYRAVIIGNIHQNPELLKEAKSCKS